jgi:hypothetical protein
MAVRPVAAEDIITIRQGGANAGCDGFLAAVQVTGGANFPGEDGFDEALVAEADLQHPSIQADQHILWVIFTLQLRILFEIFALFHFVLFKISHFARNDMCRSK